MISLLNKGRRKQLKERRLAKPTARDSSIPSSSSSLSPPPIIRLPRKPAVVAFSFCRAPAGRASQSLHCYPCVYLRRVWCACKTGQTQLDDDGARQDSDPPDRQLHEPAGDVLQTAERDLQEGKGARHPL